MFYRQLIINNKIERLFKDPQKNEVIPLGPTTLEIINYRGISPQLHGCLVASIGFDARIRPYRCKNFRHERYHIKKVVKVKNYREIFKEIRSYQCPATE